mmetsp:Transcript_17603/g.33183  ORF Transcript_17603/g.33183 Transcript_17603/m.33183 type:complete len:124 (+) Transcript_17603:38-409(+)
MTSRPPVTFHVLDTGSGVPASGMLVEISSNSSLGDNEPFEWTKFGECLTNSDGRGTGLLPASMKQIPVGTYKMKFHTKEYYVKSNTTTFYPHVEVVFQIQDPGDHYHIPLLLSPFGYSTYRGS